MESKHKIITVQATINCPIQKAWEFWTSPEHIVQWNHATKDWHTTRAENDLRVDGKFLYRMEAKDGSMGFDFLGSYKAVIRHELIEYQIGDGRLVEIVFSSDGNQTKIVESFEAEAIHSHEMQQQGWQAILTNFKKFAEN
ncbi:SRPBCC family protein [Solimicrobium silvestre]|uniref:Activator of Hsp90 ATPase homologue 1/2-like C-terminal domain-containing protein n=1 Tax=Solimicrobium silvestre TaxID=2099400 RepID=A0A2S9GT88_9BURK|nr:SRPBCC family protein [Solimicrobium silvestre]PRC90916.1 hypothetical protein S2091_4409 [Solimicrobium silvestre]